MSIERRVEKLEQARLPMKPWVSIYAPREGMSADEKKAFIAAELKARGEPDDANIIFVTFVSVRAQDGSRTVHRLDKRTEPLRQRRRARQG